MLCAAGRPRAVVQGKERPMETKPSQGTNVFLNRNYRLVFFGALVSELGAILYSFAVSFYILEITDNNAFLQGLYLALCGGMLLLATPVGGVLGDRFNKAKIMFLCDYMKGGIIVLATVLMLLFRSSDAHVLILFAVGILGNAVSGVFSPAAGALLPHIVAEEKLQQANAYFSIKSSLQSILGVVLAGICTRRCPSICCSSWWASAISSPACRRCSSATITPPPRRS